MKTVRPLELRLAAGIRIEGDCWIWTRSLTKDGYARISVGELSRLAHVIAYEYLVGPVPAGLNLDHTCHSNDPTCLGGPSCAHRACVNPRHLEPVTQKENVARGVRVFKTHCKRSHAFDEANTYWTSDGRRRCRACSAQWWRDQHQPLKQAA